MNTVSCGQRKSILCHEDAYPKLGFPQSREKDKGEGDSNSFVRNLRDKKQRAGKVKQGRRKSQHGNIFLLS
jgi:hypothetical protein